MEILIQQDKRRTPIINRFYVDHKEYQPQPDAYRDHRVKMYYTHESFPMDIEGILRPKYYAANANFPYNIDFNGELFLLALGDRVKEDDFRCSFLFFELGKTDDETCSTKGHLIKETTVSFLNEGQECVALLHEDGNPVRQIRDLEAFPTLLRFCGSCLPQSFYNVYSHKGPLPNTYISQYINTEEYHV